MNVNEALAPIGAFGRSLALPGTQFAFLVALDGEDGVDDETNAKPVARDLTHDRIEKERHIVVRNLDNSDALERLLAGGGRGVGNSYLDHSRRTRAQMLVTCSS